MAYSELSNLLPRRTFFSFLRAHPASFSSSLHASLVLQLAATLFISSFTNLTFRPHQPSALLFLSMGSTLLQIKLPSSPPRPYRPGQIRPFLRSLSSDRRSSLPPVLDRDARQAQFWESGEEGEKASIRGGRDDHSRVSPALLWEENRRDEEQRADRRFSLSFSTGTSLPGSLISFSKPFLLKGCLKQWSVRAFTLSAFSLSSSTI